MRTLLLSLALLSTPHIHAHPASADTTSSQTEYSVLLVGNSLTYTNNLPALLRAVGAANGVSITTTTFAAPGGVLSERLSEGHVANALKSRPYDALLLQEQGGHLAACMASVSAQRKAPCAASKRAYATFAELARTSGTKTLLMATWGPDERWDARVARSVGMLAKDTGSTVFHASRALRALQHAQPGTKVLPDGIHPSTQASLTLALALFRDLTGRMPQAKELRISAALLPVNAAVSPASPMETQTALAGDGKVTLVPADLVAPLIEALPNASAEMLPTRRGR